MADRKWIDVDLDGFAQLNASRPKVHVLFDLLQNALDEDISSASLELTPAGGDKWRRGRAHLVVSDDAPDGFADLRDAYTLYKSSKKKGDPTKRGRFNEGEKFVLSLCEEATITTTTGSVHFDANGARRSGRKKTEAGSVFRAVLRATRVEVDEMLIQVRDLIIPDGVLITVNGEVLEPRKAFQTTSVKLPTVVAGDDGVLRNTARNTSVSLHEHRDGASHLYELGIPVVEIDTPWDVNVHQKVPLNRDRDNVTPAYRRQLLAAVLDSAVDLLDEDTASEPWVKEALPLAAPSSVRKATDKLFGKGWVSATPGDSEADKNAIAHGVTVVSGGTLSGDQWGAVRDAGAAASSATRYTLKISGGNRVPEKAEKTERNCAVRAYAAEVIFHLLGSHRTVELWDDHGAGVAGMYDSHRIVLNLAALGSGDTFAESLDDLLIHECAHAVADDHLTMLYVNEVTRLGAKLRRCPVLWKEEGF